MIAWLHSLLGGLANLALLCATIKVLTDLLAAWLGARQQERFVAFLQRCHDALGQSSAGSVFAMPLLALSKGYERLLGPRPFSRQALRRTCVFGALFLGASLGVTGLLCGKPFAMNLPPWRSYFASLDYLQLLAKAPSFKQTGDPLFVAQNAADLARFHNWPCAIAFTVFFAVVVVVSTAFLVSLSTAVSRLFLQEMIAVRTMFRVFLLFLSSTVLLLSTAGAASLLLFILLNVWTWPLVPLFFVVSHASIAAGLGLASAASLGNWFFSAPWLRVVVILSVLPSILMAAMLAVTLVGFPFRRAFLEALAGLIRRGIRSPRGAFSFVSASSAALALLLTFLASFLGWLARLSLTMGTPSVLGLDYLSFSFFVLVLMFLLSLARAGSASSQLRVAGVLALFLGGLCVTVFGFYIQAILECVVNLPSAGAVSRGWTIAWPAFGAIVPASVIGAIVVFSKVSNQGWLKLAIRIFLVLAGWDLLFGVCAFNSFRDSLFSVGCDVLGAPMAALVLFWGHRLLFPSARAADCPAGKAAQPVSEPISSLER